MSSPGHPGEAEWRACAVCARVLDQHDEYVGDRLVGVTWTHTEVDRARGEDHPAIPVPYSQLAEVVLVCDFCSGPDPTWELPVGNFDIPEFYGPREGWGSTENWAACDECAELLSRGLWPQLTRRAAEHLARINRLAVETVLPDIQQKYRLIRRHQLGPVRPIQTTVTLTEDQQVIEGKHRRDALGGDDEDRTPRPDTEGLKGGEKGS